jgi:tetratricopeptide (TPR) repeat protein
LAAAVCAGLLLLAPSVAFPAASKPVEKARQLIEEAEFEPALKVINEALGSPDNSDAVLVQLYELQGTAYLFLSKEDKARASFERLLQADPDHQLPKSTSNKIRSLFEQVRAERKPVKLTHATVTTAKPGERLDVRAQISDVPQGAKTRLYYRRAGTEGYSSTSFAAEGADYVAKVPAFELPVEDAEYALEYYLEVGDATGRRVAGVGDALSPLRVRISAKAEPAAPTGPAPAVAQDESWYQKWWVWTIVGAVVVGAGVGAGVALTQPKDATVPITVTVK